jgi:signal transduction histidine kinase
MNPSARILVVEDNTVVLQSTVKALESIGYEVMMASSASESFRLAKEKHPNVMLVDVVLPDQSGVEVCRQIKADPDTAGIFVVLISGYQVTSEHHIAGLQAGADAYIARPIQNSELVARVQAMIRLQQVQAELRTFQQELERRVLERTAELASANKRLRSEMDERKQLEARLLQSQKIQAVGQLAAGVAHDFNNILTVIRCNTSLLLGDEQLSFESSECARQISLAADLAASLTRQLLVFTRQQVFRLRELDLNALIDDMGKMLSRTLGEHIVLRCDLAPALPAVNADPGMIEQVILNLAVNARDAMPKGGQLTIRTTAVEIDAARATRHREARPGSVVCLSVTDTGCGMDTAILQRIFEPFFTTKDVGKGTGLGLASVRSIAGQHQGWVEVESAVGCGSTFHLFLPSLAKAAREIAQPIASATGRPGTETILVVEDEPSVCALAKRILARHGYHVLTAASGVEALPVWTAHQHEIDLLLTDVLMPHGISGPELADRLRQDKPHLNVIFTSGYGPDIMTQDNVLPEDIHFLQKPYDPGLLAKTVRDCLDRSLTRPD